MSHSHTRQWALFFTWIIALTSLIATLYSSNILNMAVCHLCWYQRICIYPLAIIIGIASFRNDGNIARYTIPLTILGAIFAIYQYLEQMLPNFAPIDVCTGGPDCSTIHMIWFGFITYPFLSLIACIIMTILLFIVHCYRS